MLEIVLPSLSADKKRTYSKAFVESDVEEGDVKSEVSYGYSISSYHTSDEGSLHGEGREEGGGYTSYDSLDGYESERDKELEVHDEYNSGDDYVPTKKEKAALEKKNAVKKEPKVKAPPEPPSKASVSVLAEPEGKQSQSLEGVDPAQLERIKKALSLSQHPGTTEQEAQQALRMAMKLMEKFNVSQASVIASMETAEDKLKEAGSSIVSVRGKPGSSMYVSQWSSKASGAVADMFDCQTYSELFDGWHNSNRVDFTFYGLAANTVSAATAFEMVYNLIMTWRMANKEAKGMNAKNAYCTGVADGLSSFSRKEKKRELKEAEKAEKLRLEMEQKAEEEQRRKEIERLKQPELDNNDDNNNTNTRNKAIVEDETSLNGQSDSESSQEDLDSDSEVDEDDDSDSDYYAGPGTTPELDQQQDMETEEARDMDAVPADFRVKAEAEDIDLDKLMKDSEQRIHDNPELADRKNKKKLKDRKRKSKIEDVKAKIEEKPPVKPDEPEEKPKPAPEPGWKSAGALIAFRDATKSIADEYLKKKGIKLRSRGKYRPVELKDESARKSYNQGWEDSKKIDLKRKRLKAFEEDEVEPMFYC